MTSLEIKPFGNVKGVNEKEMKNVYKEKKKKKKGKKNSL